MFTELLLLSGAEYLPGYNRARSASSHGSGGEVSEQRGELGQDGAHTCNGARGAGEVDAGLCSLGGVVEPVS